MWTRLRRVGLDSWGAIFALVALVAGLAQYAISHLPDPNLWFDEGGQYWLSRGLNHDSPIDEPGRWIGAGVIDGMTGFNLDPPGFTVGLGAFIGILGSSPTAVRLLPFLAYTATFVIAYLIGRRILSLPRSLSLALPALPLTTALPLFYATEIRAYSAELLAVTAAVLTGALLVRSRTIRGAIPLIIVLILGTIATRYYFLVAAISVAFVYASACALSWNWRERWRQMSAVAAAYTLTALATAWNIGIFGPSEQWGYGQGYAQGGFSLRDADGPAVLTILKTNFASAEQWATGVFLILGALLLIAAVIRRQRPSTLMPEPGWLLIWSLVMSYEVVGAALSYFNDMPWDARERWSIGLWAMAAVSILGIASIAKGLVDSWNSRITRRLATLTCVVVVALATFFSYNRLTGFERYVFRSAGSQLPGQVQANLDPKLKTQWVVDYWSWPAFKWLVRESGLWPSAFPVTDAIPIGDGVLTNANWPDVLPTLQLCPPGQQSVVFHEQWNDNFPKRTIDVTNAAQRQRCRVKQVSISGSEMMLVISPPPV